jgi:hypothetical protein
MANIAGVGTGKTQTEGFATGTIVSAPIINGSSRSASMTKGAEASGTATQPPASPLTFTFTNLTAFVVITPAPP